MPLFLKADGEDGGDGIPSTHDGVAVETMTAASSSPLPVSTGATSSGGVSAGLETCHNVSSSPPHQSPQIRACEQEEHQHSNNNGDSRAKTASGPSGKGL